VERKGACQGRATLRRGRTGNGEEQGRRCECCGSLLARLLSAASTKQPCGGGHSSPLGSITRNRSSEHSGEFGRMCVCVAQWSAASADSRTHKKENLHAGRERASVRSRSETTELFFNVPSLPAVCHPCFYVVPLFTRCGRKRQRRVRSDLHFTYHLPQLLVLKEAPLQWHVVCRQVIPFVTTL
jgi:hypothetical protein